MARIGDSLAGRRVLITGAARGIGAALARRLHERGARVALMGLEPALLQDVSASCGDAPFFPCDVTDREGVEHCVASVVQAFGGLDVVVANAGVAAQVPILGGNPATFERTLSVNVLGVYYTLRAAAPHLAHDRGYALAVSSLGAAVHVPLMGAYAASKAAVEALGNAMRAEMRSSGARVGVAYFAELDTDMTRRGFGTRAARVVTGSGGALTGVAPLSSAIDALERGIALRARHIVAPRWVALVLPFRAIAQRLVELALRRRVDEAVSIAREEDAPLTTEQPR